MPRKNPGDWVDPNIAIFARHWAPWERRQDRGERYWFAALRPYATAYVYRWHHENQWYVQVRDQETGVVRDFKSEKMNDILDFVDEQMYGILPPAIALTMMAQAEKNPSMRYSSKKYGSTPAPGWAEQAVRDAGFSDVQFVQSMNGAQGPVLVYRAVRRGVPYVVNVGRLNRTDRLEVLSAPESPGQVKKNPEKLEWYDPKAVRESFLPWHPNLTGFEAAVGEFRFEVRTRAPGTDAPVLRVFRVGVPKGGLVWSGAFKRIELAVARAEEIAEESLDPAVLLAHAVQPTPGRPDRSQGKKNPLIGWYQYHTPQDIRDVDPPLRVAYMPGAEERYRKAYAKTEIPITVQLGDMPYRVEGGRIGAPVPMEGDDLNTRALRLYVPPYIDRDEFDPEEEQDLPEDPKERRKAIAAAYREYKPGTPDRVTPFLPFNLLHRLGDDLQLSVLRAAEERGSSDGVRRTAEKLKQLQEDMKRLFDEHSRTRTKTAYLGHPAPAGFDLVWDSKFIDTQAGRLGALHDVTQMISDLFALRVKTGRIGWKKEMARTPYEKRLSEKIERELPGTLDRLIEYELDRQQRRRPQPQVKKNPARGRSRKTDIYDPKEEQIRAQRQGIYESCVRRELGAPSRTPFRDSSGHRLDLRLDEDTRTALIKRCAFAIGTGVPQRDDRLAPGSQSPTRKSIEESKRRYADVDHLIRNRQDYEETLGLMRKSGFYRAVPEVTQTGIKFFVWPMKPGERLPRSFASRDTAEAERDRRNLRNDPRSTGKWWAPPGQAYDEVELRNWLPPLSVFEE